MITIPVETGDEQGNSRAETTSVIYVSGFGRSGSSLLESLLSIDLPALSAGELCNLFAWADQGRPCTCGAVISACEVWGPIIELATAETGRSPGQLDRLTREIERDAKTEIGPWREVWGVTFRALRDIHGALSVIDSSKTTSGMRRVELLSSLAGCEVALVIQLVRALGGVTYSVASGSNRLLEADVATKMRVPQTKVAYGWLAANASALRQEKFAAHGLRIRYEDLEARIDEVRLVARDSLREPGGQKLLGHTIAGNRMFRSSAPLEIKLDERWLSDLPPVRRAIANCVEKGAVLAGLVPPRGAGSREGVGHSIGDPGC